MKKSKILAIVMCVIAAVACFGFAACNGGTKHNFAATWESDRNYHWHACTDEGCTEVSDKAEHTFENGKCTACERTDVSNLTVTDLYVKLVDSVADVKKSEGYGAAIKDAAITVKGNEEMSLDVKKNETEYMYIIPDVEGKANAEIFVGRDADGEFVLYLTANITLNLKKSELNTEDLSEFKDVIATGVINANVIIEKGIVYFNAEMAANYDGIPEAYKEFNSEEKDVVKKSFTIEELLNELFGNPEGIGPIIAIIKNVLPEIVAKAETEFKPVIENIVAKNKEFIDKYLKKIIDNQFKVTETNDGYVITVDADKTKATIDDMFDLTVGEFFDKYVGKGAYDKMALAVSTLLNMNAKTTIVAAESAIGMDLNALAAKINGFIAGMMPEGEEPATIEKLLGIPEGTTFRDYVLEKVGDKSFAELINEYVNGEEGGEFDVNKVVTDAFASTKKQTMFDLMLSLMNQISGGKLPVEDLIAQKETIRTTAKQMVDVMNKAFKVELGIKDDGTFSFVNVNVNFGKDVISGLIGKGAEKNEIPEIAISFSTTVYKGEFKNVLGVNYAEVIEAVKKGNAEKPDVPAPDPNVPNPENPDVAA
jgi:lipoprotein